MAFDPDAFLLEDDETTSPLDTGSYSATQQSSVPSTFDVDAFLNEEEPTQQVGTLQGIANAAQNAFDSSRQSLLAVGGVDKDQAEQISKLEYAKKSRQLAPDYAAYQKAEGWDAVGAFLKNPIEVTTNIVAEGLAGSLPALGAGVTAGVAGAGAGSVVPGIGTGIGYTAGQVAGTFAGSLATEYGGKVLEELQNAGMDLSDPQSVQKYFSDESLMAPARDKALLRGVPVAAFDAVSAGIGGKLGRVFGSKVLKEGEKIVGREFATKTGEALTELGAQGLLGGGGEVAGAVAAGEPISGKAVFGEAIGEVGPGSIEVLQGRIADRKMNIKNAEDKARNNVLDLSETLEANNSPLTAQVVQNELAATLAAQAKEEEAAKAEAAAKLQSEAQVAQSDQQQLPTDALPTETPGATYGRETEIYDVFGNIRRKPTEIQEEQPVTGREILPVAQQTEQQQYATQEIIQPEGVREEPQDGTQVRPTTETGIGNRVLDTEGREVQGQVDPVVTDLQAVADNTATPDQLTSLSQSGLVDIVQGQPVINETGQSVLAEAEAPLPKLTPDERRAEIAATTESPATKEDIVSATNVANKIEEENKVLEQQTKFNPPSTPTLQDARSLPDAIAKKGKTLSISGGKQEKNILDPKESKKRFDEIGYDRQELKLPDDMNDRVSNRYGNAIANIKSLYSFEWLGAHFHGGVAVNPEVKGTQRGRIVAHELGHASHSLLGDKINKDQNVLNELKAIEELLYPGLRDKVSSASNPDASFFNYLLSPNELIAEFNVERVSNPERAIQVAPALSALLESAEKMKGLVADRKAFPTFMGVIRESKERLKVKDLESRKIKEITGDVLKNKSKQWSDRARAIKMFAAKNDLDWAKLSLRNLVKTDGVPRSFAERVVELTGNQELIDYVKELYPEPTIGEKSQTSPMIGEQPTQPIISEKPQISEIVGAETPDIVEQEQVATEKTPAPEVAPMQQEVGINEVLRRAENAATREEAGQIGRDFAALDPSLPPPPSAEYEIVKAISNKAGRRPYNADVLTEENITAAKEAGLVTKTKIPKLTESGRNLVTDGDRAARNRDMALGDITDRISDQTVSAWDAKNNPDSAAFKERIAAQPTPAVSETITEPTGIKVGDKVTNKNNTTITYTVEEVLPQTETERVNGEQQYSVRNKKGELEIVGNNDIQPFKGVTRKRKLAKAVSPQAITPPIQTPTRNRPIPQRYRSVSIQAKVQAYLKEELDALEKFIKSKEVITDEDQEIIDNIKKRIDNANKYNFHESELMDQAELEQGVSDFFNGSIPDRVVFIDDIGENYRAAYDIKTGEIIVNRAYFLLDKNIDTTLGHELAHFAFVNDNFRAQFIELWDGLTQKARDKISAFVEEHYSDYEKDALPEEKIVTAFQAMLEANPEIKTFWDRIIDLVVSTYRKFFNKEDYIPRNATKTALDLMNQIRQEYIAGVEYTRPDGTPFKFYSRENRAQVNGEPGIGNVLTSAPNLFKDTDSIVKQYYFDSEIVTPENRNEAFLLLHNLRDRDYAVAINKDIRNKIGGDFKEQQRAVVGVVRLKNALKEFADRSALSGDPTFLKKYNEYSNQIDLGIEDVNATNIATALSAISSKSQVSKIADTLKEGEVAQVSSALFGTSSPTIDQNNVVKAGIDAVNQVKVNDEDILDEISNVESRTGVNIRAKVDKQIETSNKPQKSIVDVAYSNLKKSTKKPRGVKRTTLVTDNVKEIVSGNLTNYRQSLIDQSADGLQADFWQTMSNEERKQGPLAELDQAQNKELAKIVKDALIKAGLKGEPPNTKMTDIEKVASILSEQKLSLEKQAEADKRITQDINDRRNGELSKVEDEDSIDAINDKYDAIQAAWDQAMARQTNMPVSDIMIRRLLNSEMKEAKISANEIAQLRQEGQELNKKAIIDSLMSKIYGVSKESQTGVEIDEDYSNLKSYLENELNNLVDIQTKKIDAANALTEARRAEQLTPDYKASQIIEKMAAVADGSTPLNKPQENQVRSIVEQDLRQRPNMGRKEAWKNMLVGKLINAGVSETRAQILADLTWRQHEINSLNREIKEIETAATRGSLGVIIERIKNTPLSEQVTPEWRKDVILDYLKSAGLSEKQAETAAKLYDNIISEKIAEAQQKAFTDAISTMAPWKNYASRNGQLAKNALSKVLNAVRVGALDPTQTAENIIAKQNGWTGFSDEDYKTIAQMDQILSNKDSDEIQKHEAMKKINDIISKAKLPVTIKQALAAYYTAQALSGVPTFTVNIFSPAIVALRNLTIDVSKATITDPSKIPVIFDFYLESMRTWYNQVKFSFKNEIYPNDVVEYLNGTNSLKELYNRGKKEWAKGNYVAGLRDMVIGSTQITGRVLSALDQGSIAMLENQALGRYALEAMTHSGIPKSQRNNVANMVLHTKREMYAELIASGMDKDRAGVLSDMAMKQSIQEGLDEMKIDADNVLNSAINDALLSVGRNKTLDAEGFADEQKRLTDNGVLSYLPIKFLEQMASNAAQAGPAMQIFSKMLYGFALVPARATSFFAWFSPYGFVRLSIDKFKRNKGEESPYALSLGNDLQRRQRLNEAIAGTMIMMALPILSSASTDDDDEKFKIVVTGAGPDANADKQYRDAWLKKYSPYSIHIVYKGKITKINFGRGGEAIMFPLIAGSVKDDWMIKQKLNLAKKNPADLNQASTMIGSAFLALAQRGPYAAFGKSLFDATKSGQTTQELAGQFAYMGKTFIPVFGSSLARNISDFMTDPVDKSSMAGAMYSNLPIVGPMMGTKALNAFGQPMRADDWSDRLFRLGVPMVFSFPNNSPLGELNELVLKKGDGPTIPTRVNAEKRMGRILTDKEFELYVSAYGEYVSRSMFSSRRSLERMRSADYSAELQEYSNDANDRAVRIVKRMYGK